MGEHKLHGVGNGDGQERKLTTHIVEIVDLPVPTYDNAGNVPESIEAAYQRIAERAKAEDSFILNVVQSVDVYQTINGADVGARMIVTITAQRVTREELERQQRLQRMGGR